MIKSACYFCRSRLEERRISRIQEYKGHWFIIENVPALVCEQCGEQYFAPDAHDLIVDIVTGSQEPVLIEQVGVYDASAD